MGCNECGQRRQAIARAQQRKQEILRNDQRSMLLHFYHGLGDAALFRLLLASIKQQRPNWTIDVITTWGKHTLLTDVARNVYTDRNDVPRYSYTQQKKIAWWEAKECINGCVSNKATRCLREEFNLEPILPRCPIIIPDDTQQYVDEWIDEHTPGQGKFVVFHYMGNTAAKRKDLTHAQAEQLAETIHQHGYPHVMLDWDDRCDSFNGEIDAGMWSSLWQNAPGERKTGNGVTIAALIHRAAAFVGIDSGPAYVAALTDTPTHIIYTMHHPCHYCPDKHTAPNVIVHAPTTSAAYAKGARRDNCDKYLRGQYNLREYKVEHWSNLPDHVGEVVLESLTKQNSIQ